MQAIRSDPHFRNLYPRWPDQIKGGLSYYFKDDGQSKDFSDIKEGRLARLNRFIASLEAAEVSSRGYDAWHGFVVKMLAQQRTWLTLETQLAQNLRDASMVYEARFERPGAVWDEVRNGNPQWITDINQYLNNIERDRKSVV